MGTAHTGNGMKRLVLFDVDGTLLAAGGTGKRAIHDAMMQVYGETGDIDGYRMGGRTDPQIARELLTGAGWAVDDVLERLPALWAAYVCNLRREVAGGEVRALRGIPALLERIEAEGGETVLGLLTGNLVEGAQLKVDAAGLGFARFRVGAYGSDHWVRAELPAVALRRARDATGLGFAGKEVVIVGDTPHDVSCGEHLGVRTIATATGRHSVDELAACGPDHVFADLSDADAVWEAIAA